jgi:hypothetical protein
VTAELQLAARPLEKHHQLPRDFQRNIPPQVLFDQRERQIQSGRDAGRRSDPAIAYVNRIRVDDDARKCFREAFSDRPMRRDTATF